MIASPTNVVKDIADKTILLHVHSKEIEHRLKELGASRRFPFSKHWRVRYSSENELGQLLGAFRDAGISFLGAAAGWPPSSVFEDLRERGLVSGKFEEVVRHGSKEPECRER